MLNDDVVREVDILAHKLGTNRSNLVNNILAEYVNFKTPDKTISDLIDLITQSISSSREIIPIVSSSSSNVSLSSSLNFKYRPTIKYSVDLYQSYDDSFGRLTVIFRTQSQLLLDKIARFFAIWKATEDKYLKPNIASDVEYALYNGRFTRSLIVPSNSFSNESLANAISDYVKLVDMLLKGFLLNEYTISNIEEAYITFLENSKYII